jgi:hypothetical protein
LFAIDIALEASATSMRFCLRHVRPPRTIGLKRCALNYSQSEPASSSTFTKSRTSSHGDRTDAMTTSPNPSTDNQSRMSAFPILQTERLLVRGLAFAEGVAVTQISAAYHRLAKTRSSRTRKARRFQNRTTPVSKRTRTAERPAHGVLRLDCAVQPCGSLQLVAPAVNVSPPCVLCCGRERHDDPLH